MSRQVCILLGVMRGLRKAVLPMLFLALTSCSSNNDNAHTTATTNVPPPVRQQLRVSIRPATKVPAKPDDPKRKVDPSKALMTFNLPNGKTFRAGEDVTIDFSLANATLKGDGGNYRVRYIVDDEEMQWIDRWEEIVLSGWTPGNHTIRLELVGPDGWPYKNGDYNVAVREFTITK
jgi:hypothetical protein